MESNFLVDIVMVTYNHEKYISQAIESVLMQKSSFPYLLIIGEDCSTDKTPEICRSYAEKFPDKILLFKNESNLGLARNYKRLFDACSAKYIAILEGDDYWTDENKLQKQTEILDSDEGIGLVYAAIYEYYEDYNRLVPQKDKINNRRIMNQGYIYEKLIRCNFISALTVVFRRSILLEKINFQYFIDNNFKTIDYPLWLGISIHSKIVFMKEVVGVYRISPSSISNSSFIINKFYFWQTIINAVNYYLTLYPVPQYNVCDLENAMNEALFSNSLSQGDYLSAKHFSNMINKKPIINKMKYLVSKAKVTVYLYSILYNFIFKVRLLKRKISF